MPRLRLGDADRRTPAGHRPLANPPTTQTRTESVTDHEELLSRVVDGGDTFDRLSKELNTQAAEELVSALDRVTSVLSNRVRPMWENSSAEWNQEGDLAYVDETKASESGGTHEEVDMNLTMSSRQSVHLDRAVGAALQALEGSEGGHMSEFGSKAGASSQGWLEDRQYDQPARRHRPSMSRQGSSESVASSIPSSAAAQSRMLHGSSVQKSLQKRIAAQTRARAATSAPPSAHSGTAHSRGRQVAKSMVANAPVAGQTESKVATGSARGLRSRSASPASLGPNATAAPAIKPPRPSALHGVDTPSVPVDVPEEDQHADPKMVPVELLESVLSNFEEQVRSLQRELSNVNSAGCPVCRGEGNNDSGPDLLTEENQRLKRQVVLLSSKIQEQDGQLADIRHERRLLQERVRVSREREKAEAEKSRREKELAVSAVAAQVAESVSKVEHVDSWMQTDEVENEPPSPPEPPPEERNDSIVAELINWSVMKPSPAVPEGSRVAEKRLFEIQTLKRTIQMLQDTRKAVEEKQMGMVEKFVDLSRHSKVMGAAFRQWSSDAVRAQSIRFITAAKRRTPPRGSTPEQWLALASEYSLLPAPNPAVPRSREPAVSTVEVGIDTESLAYHCDENAPDWPLPRSRVNRAWSHWKSVVTARISRDDLNGAFAAWKSREDHQKEHVKLLQEELEDATSNSRAIQNTMRMKLAIVVWRSNTSSAKLVVNTITEASRRNAQFQYRATKAVAIVIWKEQMRRRVSRNRAVTQLRFRSLCLRMYFLFKLWKKKHLRFVRTKRKVVRSMQYRVRWVMRRALMRWRNENRETHLLRQRDRLQRDVENRELAMGRLRSSTSAAEKKVEEMRIKLIDKTSALFDTKLYMASNWAKDTAFYHWKTKAALTSTTRRYQSATLRAGRLEKDLVEARLQVATAQQEAASAAEAEMIARDKVQLLLNETEVRDSSFGERASELRRENSELRALSESLQGELTKVIVSSKNYFAQKEEADAKEIKMRFRRELARAERHWAHRKARRALKVWARVVQGKPVRRAGRAGARASSGRRVVESERVVSMIAGRLLKLYYVHWHQRVRSTRHVARGLFHFMRRRWVREARFGFTRWTKFIETQRYEASAQVVRLQLRKAQARADSLDDEIRQAKSAPAQVEVWKRRAEDVDSANARLRDRVSSMEDDYLKVKDDAMVFANRCALQIYATIKNREARRAWNFWRVLTQKNRTGIYDTNRERRALELAARGKQFYSRLLRMKTMNVLRLWRLAAWRCSRVRARGQRLSWLRATQRSRVALHLMRWNATMARRYNHILLICRRGQHRRAFLGWRLVVLHARRRKPLPSREPPLSKANRQIREALELANSRLGREALLSRAFCRWVSHHGHEASLRFERQAEILPSLDAMEAMGGERNDERLGEPCVLTEGQAARIGDRRSLRRGFVRWMRGIFHMVTARAYMARLSRTTNNARMRRCWGRWSTMVARRHALQLSIRAARFSDGAAWIDGPDAAKSGVFENTTPIKGRLSLASSVHGTSPEGRRYLAPEWIRREMISRALQMRSAQHFVLFRAMLRWAGVSRERRIARSIIRRMRARAFTAEVSRAWRVWRLQTVRAVWQRRGLRDFERRRATNYSRRQQMQYFVRWVNSVYAARYPEEMGQEEEISTISKIRNALESWQAGPGHPAFASPDKDVVEGRPRRRSLGSSPWATAPRSQVYYIEATGGDYRREDADRLKRFVERCYESADEFYAHAAKLEDRLVRKLELREQQLSVAEINVRRLRGPALRRLTKEQQRLLANTPRGRALLEELEKRRAPAVEVTEV